jgi:hypothetical protein
MGKTEAMRHESFNRYARESRGARAGALLLAGALLAVSGARANPVGLGTPAVQEQPAKKQITLDDLQVMVRGEGLKGTMHGANHATGAYVFTWWDPDSFFRNLNFALIAANDDVRAALGTLERHQQLTLRGTMVRAPGMQTHIRVEALEPGERWSPGVHAVQPQPPSRDMRRALQGRRQIRALVHAIDDDPGILVIEYGGEVLPVVVPEHPELRKQVAGLYRGDRIEIRYRLRPAPPRPVHLELDPSGGRPALTVTDAIRVQHETMRTVEGNLVLFPKSPALRRSIWGVEERGPDGLHRYFTIFNFDDLKDQDQTDAKLRAAWDARPGVVDARNKYVHPGVRVRVTGRVNNPAQNQANPALHTDSSRVEVLPR